MFRRIGADPFLLLTAGKRLARLHAEIHEKEISGILTVKEKLRQEIEWAKELSEDEKQKIINRLLLLPDFKQLCHFDFHPGNIMVNGDHIQVLDWLTACSGNPAADIARTCILLKYGEVRNGDRLSRLILSITKACIRGAYIRNVLRLSGISRDEILQWTVPVAAARLSEWLTEHERERLLILNSIKNVESQRHLYRSDIVSLSQRCTLASPPSLNFVRAKNTCCFIYILGGIQYQTDTRQPEHTMRKTGLFCIKN